jgi:hypothetical protein
MLAEIAVFAGVSVRPTVQRSPGARVALLEQVSLEMVILSPALTRPTVSGPDAVVEVFVATKTTYVPEAPGATEPRSGPPFRLR